MSSIQVNNNSTTKKQSKNDSTSWLKNEKLSFGLIISGIILIVIAIIAFLWMDVGFSTTEQIRSDKWGQIGDFIGGIVGTLWALAGVLLFYLALTEQRKDTKINQKALALQVTALNQQISEFELQTKELELQRKELVSSRKVYEKQNNKNTTIRISFLFSP